MSREKGARLIFERKVRLLRGQSTIHSHVFAVLGDSADPLKPEPYRVVREYHGSRLSESCDCICPRVCSHIEAARIFSEVAGTPEEEG